MKILLSVLFVAFSITSHAKLSKDCMKTLRAGAYNAHEMTKAAIQFGAGGKASQSILNQAKQILDDAVNSCIESAVNSKKRSEEAKIEVANKVRSEANQYLAEIGVN